MNLNNVQLIGRVAKEPELKTTQSGQSVTSFSLATNREWKDKQGNKISKTDWHSLVFWGKLAEIVTKYVVKGQELFVSGRLEYREYENKDKQTVHRTDIIVSDMQMGQKPKGYDEKKPYPIDSAKKKEDDIPTINLDEDEINIDDVPF